MTPEEKAIELYSYYDNLLNKDFIFPIVHDNQLKQCALIAVDEIINYLTENSITGTLRGYWKEVKQEIEKL
jgi:hypothetical protein